MSKRLRQTDHEAIHKITAGQVIIDIENAVKELLENSLDAGATNIEILFKNYGLDSFEVSDNGTGISEDDFDSIAKRHHTLKLSKFEDLHGNVTTYGFRGEAIASLCNVADVKILTSTKDSTPKATVLELDQLGNIVSKSVSSRKQGTTTTVSNLFGNLPVRRKILLKHIKREFNKAISLIQAYCVVCTGVKITVYNSPGSSRRMLFSTSHNGTMLTNIINIFKAPKKALMEVDINIDVKLELFNYAKYLDSQEQEEPEMMNVRVYGYISYHSYGLGRTANDRQMIFINSKPVSLPRFTKMVNEVYHFYNRLQYPMVFLNFKIDPNFLDINVTPDKRTINFFNEGQLLEELKEAIDKLYGAQNDFIPSTLTSSFTSKFTPVSKFESSNEQADETQNADETYNDACHKEPPIEVDDREGDGSIEISQENLPEETSNDGGEEDMSTGLSDDDQLETEKGPDELNKEKNFDEEYSLYLDEDGNFCMTSTSKERLGEEDVNNEIDDVEEQLAQKEDTETNAIKLEQHSQTLESDSNLQNVKEENLINQPESINKENSHQSVNGVTLHPANCNCKRGSILASKSFTTANSVLESKVSGDFLRKRTHSALNYAVTKEVHLRDIPVQKKVDKSIEEVVNELIVENMNKDSSEAESQLSLIIKKSDFLGMRIIGQFNLGFILVIKENTKDIFIIDQHASDEKFNFERFTRELTFESQPLAVPQELNLSTLDSLIVMENLHILKMNGFDVTVEDNENDEGQHLLLRSLPISKKVVFDISDLHELIGLIKDNQDIIENENISSETKLATLRCSKIRSMLAMRACRYSIMVGKTLNEKTMLKVVRNLSTLDKPWNCPHGRPTMRHLTQFNQLDTYNDDYMI